MTNWCTNEITISGPRMILETLARQAETCGGLFEAIRPMPTMISGARSPSDRGAMNEREWRRMHWGTTGDVPIEEFELAVDFEIAVDMVKRTATLTGTVDTPWTPPLKALEDLGRRYPKLRITMGYFEGGNAIGGYLLVQDGKAYRTLDNLDALVALEPDDERLDWYVDRVPMLGEYLDALSEEREAAAEAGEATNGAS